MPPISISSVRAALRDYGPAQAEGTRYASVAIVLCECNAIESVYPPASPTSTPGPLTHVLLIQRAIHPGDPWSGHLAFPGGRRDVNDRDGLATAVRETREEVGVPLDPSHQLLGRLGAVTARGAGQPGLVIEPFVFEAPYQPTFQLDEREVARAFWVPLPALLSGQHDTFVEVTRGSTRFRMPATQIHDQVLWGMTYEMLRSLAKLAQWLR